MTTFWTAALAGGLWTPLDEGKRFTAAQAVKYCQEELKTRSGRMPNGEFAVTAVKAVSGTLTIMVER
jgi:hypothetical protein